MRPLLGKELPLYANLGLAQIEKLLKLKAQDKVAEMLDMIDADGVMIHINPLQEWLQPEGDRFERPALETLEGENQKKMRKKWKTEEGKANLEILLGLTKTN